MQGVRYTHASMTSSYMSILVGYIALASGYLHLVTEFSVHNCRVVNANNHDCFDLEWVKVRQSKMFFRGFGILVTVVKIPRSEFSDFL